VTPGVNMANPVNVIYDFIPATGAALTPAQLTREDVDIATCNVCHEKLAFHGGSARVETRYCVVCHTEQRAYGQAKAVSTAGKFPALTETATVNAATGITSYSYTPSTNIADNEVAGNFVTLIHKIHNGTALVKDNYHYAGLAFNNKGFSKLGGGQRMCSTCHSGTAATNADNYKNLPSRQACGACHDGINWETGGGSTLADKAAATAVGAIVATSGHVGRAQADDSRCILCHTPDLNKIDHRMENITKNNPEITAGLATFTYDIKSVTVNAANDTIIEFGIKQRLAPSTTDTLVSWCLPQPACQQSADRLHGQPELPAGLCVAAGRHHITGGLQQPRSGRSAQPRSVSIAQLLSTNNAANGTLVCLATTGLLHWPPSRARCLGLPGRRQAARRGPAGLLHAGLRPRWAPLQCKTWHATPSRWSRASPVTWSAARWWTTRSAANCHEWFEGHGGNRVKETQVCVVCHVPGLATSGRGIADSVMNNWTFDKASSKIIADWEVRQVPAERRTETAGRDQQLQGHDPRHPRRSRTRDALPGRT
jgi:hypothetical protein